MRSWQVHHPNASLGLGLCQGPSEAMSALAFFGPQLRRWYGQALWWF